MQMTQLFWQKMKLSYIVYSKYIVFGARNTHKYNFYLDENIIEIVDHFKYLGAYFSKSRSFLKARKHVTEQARKAQHVLYKRIRNLNLPIDLQLKLYVSMSING